MKQLLKALESGKRRGYDEVRQINSVSYLFQYAIKKENGVFSTYVLRIEESKYDVFEDYACEEMKTFQTFENAIEHLKAKGAEISKITSIKGTLPF